MSIIVQDANLSICLWILGSIAIVIALLLLSVFDGKREELRETIIFPEGSITAAVVDAFIAPEERLKKLEGKINSKYAKFEITQEKLEETKRSISELEITSEEVQSKYQELLKQLKVELAKTEKECQNIHNQIEKITSKRDKLKQELSEIYRINSKTVIYEDIFGTLTRNSKHNEFLNSDEVEIPRKSFMNSNNEKFKFSVESSKLRF